jgi:predicted metal-dependent enzyme (double-stranded beta helix superfamily)
METDDYSIVQLAADLRGLRGETNNEREILSRAWPLARRAALAKESWLNPYLYEADPEQGFSIHLLHEEPDHTLAIFSVSWLPGRGTPPHDHGTWALVAGVDGLEMNKFFERLDDRTRPGHAELKKVNEKVLGVGEVIAMPTGWIHIVWNETEKVTLSLNIYGKHLNFTERSQFDLERQTETPFLKLA